MLVYRHKCVRLDKCLMYEMWKYIYKEKIEDDTVWELNRPRAPVGLALQFSVY